MKKLSQSQLLRLAHIARMALRRRIARRRKRANYNIEPTARIATIYRRGRFVKSTWLEKNGATMPSVFCLHKNPYEVLDFIQSLGHRFDQALVQFRGKVPTRNKPSPWYDFSTISEISPSAALVLAAEFDRARIIAKTKLFAIDVDQWAPNVATTLRQIGLFELLEIDQPSSTIGLYRETERSSIILRMQSGDEHDGQKLAELKERLVAIAAHAIGWPEKDEEEAVRAWRDRFLTVYTILSEAMDNVVEHAYRKAKPGRLNSVHRWWMTAAVDPSDRRLVVAIYDQGSTIPATLPGWRNFNRVDRVWNRLFGSEYDPDDTSEDGMALRTALKIAVSSTNEEFRGKGLSMMADFLNSCRGGRLRIISRCGTLLKEKEGKAVVETHSQRLPGTLVEWEVAL